MPAAEHRSSPFSADYRGVYASLLAVCGSLGVGVDCPVLAWRNRYRILAMLDGAVAVLAACCLACDIGRMAVAHKIVGGGAQLVRLFRYVSKLERLLKWVDSVDRDVEGLHPFNCC